MSKVTAVHARRRRRWPDGGPPRPGCPSSYGARCRWNKTASPDPAKRDDAIDVDMTTRAVSISSRDVFAADLVALKTGSWTTSQRGRRRYDRLLSGRHSGGRSRYTSGRAAVPTLRTIVPSAGDFTVSRARPARRIERMTAGDFAAFSRRVDTDSLQPGFGPVRLCDGAFPSVAIRYEPD